MFAVALVGLSRNAVEICKRVFQVVEELVELVLSRYLNLGLLLQALCLTCGLVMLLIGQG